MIGVSVQRQSKFVSLLFTYLFLVLVGILMIYPLLFMFFGSFKTNSDLLRSLKLWPSTFTFEYYRNGWRGTGQYSFGVFFANTVLLVLPTVFCTLLSSSLVSYGFSRFQFRFRNILFILMLSTLMLPHTVTIIPKFILFNRLKWLNTYNTFIIPALFAGNPFFIFMMVQFFRGIPIELDNVAKIDGCNSFRILYNIHIPLMKPVVFSVFVFQFMWTWNNFFDALVYISDVRRYPLSLALRMSIDSTTGIMWNEVLAMSFLSILPSIVVFFLAQKYFVEGIATTGMKG